MYDPPRICKNFLRRSGDLVCQNVSGLLVEQAKATPGHNGNPRTSGLIRYFGLCWTTFFARLMTCGSTVLPFLLKVSAKPGWKSSDSHPLPLLKLDLYAATTPER